MSRDLFSWFSMMGDFFSPFVSMGDLISPVMSVVLSAVLSPNK